MTGGAAMQHVPAGVFLPALASVSRFSDCCRWMIQTWSRESTETPIVEPSTQWFGNGFGQNGSTSNRGATPGAPHSAAGAAAAVAGVAAVAAALGAGGVALLQAASSCADRNDKQNSGSTSHGSPHSSAVPLRVRACSSLG